MTQNFGNAFIKKPPHKHGAPVPEPVVRSALAGKAPAAPKPTYAKIFRWQLPEDRMQARVTVNCWQIHQLAEGAADSRSQGGRVAATIPDVPAHKTHHYMLLVDGQPAHDKNSDGLAVPHGPQEKRYQMMTGRGPRLFMLFAQTK